MREHGSTAPTTEIDAELRRRGLSGPQLDRWWKESLAQPGSLSRAAAWRDHPDLRGEVRRQAGETSVLRPGRERLRP